ncbi:MAG: dTDP-4-dehydrorhamnose reductase [Flavobacteriaceae bacterium]
MKHVLVTGGKGQLATCIKDLAQELVDYTFIFVDYDELDITKKEEVTAFFEMETIDFCVNCAAYTAVDKAESEPQLANAINSDGVRHLVESCLKHNVQLIHISTDFVFDGNQSTPYNESDMTNPLGVYGQGKLHGEEAIISNLRKYFILRTSWLYSEHGHNFLKTMLRLGRERERMSVVCDQIGTPTYAGDLAKVILNIIQNNTVKYGIYHYSDEGVASWYDFAHAIFDLGKVNCLLMPIKTEAYPTPAKRPAYSVMDKSKIKNDLQIEIPYWRDSLVQAIKRMDHNQ